MIFEKVSFLDKRSNRYKMCPHRPLSLMNCYFFIFSISVWGYHQLVDTNLFTKNILLSGVAILIRICKLLLKYENIHKENTWKTIGFVPIRSNRNTICPGRPFHFMISGFNCSLQNNYSVDWIVTCTGYIMLPHLTCHHFQNIRMFKRVWTNS